MLAANKLQNVRRRAERAMDNKVCVTCPASRNVMMMADALAVGRQYVMFTEDPQHCASAMYSVLESLFKARAKLAALKEEPKCSTR